MKKISLCLTANETNILSLILERSRKELKHLIRTKDNKVFLDSIRFEEEALKLINTLMLELD